VGPRAGLDDMEKLKYFNLLGLELRPLGRPARSQSLNQQSYRGSQRSIIRLFIKPVHIKIRISRPQTDTDSSKVAFGFKPSFTQP
jgi:hypothetical protein